MFEDFNCDIQYKEVSGETGKGILDLFQSVGFKIRSVFEEEEMVMSMTDQIWKMGLGEMKNKNKKNINDIKNLNEKD